MHPSQALETWWHCTNAMPELAGCVAVTERVLALPTQVTSPADRELSRRLHAPQQTVVEGAYRDGKLTSLRVTPESRRVDVEMPK